MPVISALTKQRQENRCKFEDKLKFQPGQVTWMTHLHLKQYHSRQKHSIFLPHVSINSVYSSIKSECLAFINYCLKTVDENLAY